MKVILILCLVFVVVHCSKWDRFKNAFKKNYNTAEKEERRKAQFYKKVDKIIKHNDLYKQNKVTYKIGINRFSDLSTAEFSERTRGIPKLTNEMVDKFFTSSYNGTIGLLRGTLPDFVDWRQNGSVGPILDQGKKCGGCYSFAAAASLEGFIHRSTKQLHQFSTQQGIDCSFDFDNMGCRGGIPSQVFDYLKSRGGITFASAYPYNETENVCQDNNPNMKKIQVHGYVAIPSGDEEALKRAVAIYGPVTAGVHFGIQTFKDYEEGVYFSPECNPRYVDHAITIIGYGTTDKGQDYWLIKNSFGESWGMKGYGMIARNKNNHCGIATIASYPVIKTGTVTQTTTSKPVTMAKTTLKPTTSRPKPRPRKI